MTPRQCPGCKTWYSPYVEKCECVKSQSCGVTFRAGDPNLPITGAGTTMCKEGQHDCYINSCGGMVCKKCGHFPSIPC